MRYLEVKNYKNIGVQNKQEKDERLYLNNSFNGDKLGGLVIILGENNTGKSNLLKALGCFSEHVNEFKKNCTPNYLGFKDAITQLGLCAEEKSGKNKNNVFEANIEIKNDEVSYSLTPTTEQLKSVCFALLNSLGGLEANTKTDFINKLNRTNNGDSLLKLFNEIDQLLSNKNPTSSSHVDYENTESVLKDYPLKEYADVKHFLHSKLGQVFYYKPTKSFEIEDLMTTPDDLTQSEFFELLFNAIDQNAFKEIKEAYNAYTEKNREVI